ncbi:branched-chain amino acid ABC transporter permease protein (plasmid) [Rhizobium etli]|uniref:Branched-chain amino acid ABC transporter permease protein n=1 Tax=Rhizobium etli TaxID=29449 RepID=A0AAN1EMU7_RHIET|nr:branched-chain amino acid ABC transporter permease [Rhizobium etli]ARQ13227.1 branched-chain amino acid ABC transporter permease protein [Rhizobium etli]
MRQVKRPLILYTAVLLAYLLVGLTQSWTLALTLLCDGLIVAIAALGVNIQWGYAGLFNVGVAGFFAFGGLAVALVAMPLNPEAWSAGTPMILAALAFGALIIFLTARVYRSKAPEITRLTLAAVLLIAGLIGFRIAFDPAVVAVEALNPASAGNVGGLGLPVPLSWLLGGIFAAGAAWVVAKTALGLRSDYLAIATLGISQIIIIVLKNEEWLDRGVKNITSIDRWPVPQEASLQQQDWFGGVANYVGTDVRTASTIFVALCFASLLAVVLLVLVLLAECSLKSPWGRMMRAIRDNETAAEAMGKNVKQRHLQVFILGSAVIGIAGALYVTLHGLFSPVSYDDPLRYTFLIWAMVILGGSGNNWGAVLGALIVMLIWGQAENLGPALFQLFTAPLAEGPLKAHLIDTAVQMRLPMVGLMLLLVLRFSPRGLLPEK